MYVAGLQRRSPRDLVSLFAEAILLVSAIRFVNRVLHGRTCVLTLISR